MSLNVTLLKDHASGVTKVHAGGFGVICEIPFDKSYLMPDIQAIVETAQVPIDWATVGRLCTEKIAGSPSRAATSDPIKFTYKP